MSKMSAAKTAFAALIGVLAFAAPSQSLAQSDADPTRPQKHFTVARPAGLTGADAESIYQRLKDDLVEVYRLSGIAYTRAYAGWRRYNTTPTVRRSTVSDSSIITRTPQPFGTVCSRNPDLCRKGRSWQKTASP